MGSIFRSLVNATGAFKVYNQAFSVVQNNIANANTPGYVKQDQVLVSLAFSSDGAPGGIMAGPLISARSAYLERSVHQQQGYLGEASQRAGDLSALQPHFSVQPDSGIPGALNQLFGAFSALAVNPNDAGARQSVLERAAAAAAGFQQTAAGLRQASANVDHQTRSAVAGVNELAQRVAQVNEQYRRNANSVSDPSLDAQMHAALEELSALAGFTTIRTADGAMNVYLGGQTILVQGDRALPLQADITATGTVVRNAAGEDVSGLVQSGRLKALLEEKNVVLPGFTSELDAMAASFADAVNLALDAGLDRNGQPPAVPLFVYDASRGAALTLSVSALSPEEIAAAAQGAPGGNANAIAIAELAHAPLAPGGHTLTEAYANLGARLGRSVVTARQEQSQFQDMLAQSRAYRSQQSGVSLDEEAAKLLQLQQSYQAMGQLISVLSSLTETLLGILR